MEIRSPRRLLTTGLGCEVRQGPTGRWNGSAQFPPPLPGLALLFAENRWFKPPAKVRCPSGTNLATALKVHDTRKRVKRTRWCC